jgi:hypothetical protein
MSKYSLNFLFLIILLSCSPEQKGFDINPELIEPFFRNDHLYPENPKFEFSEVQHYQIDLNNNNRLDTIILRKIKDWNDPGDFHQIEIILDNDSTIVETEFGGWVRFGQNYTVNETLIKTNLIDSDLILVSNFNQNQKVVLAFGWVYASQPGLVTIFEANGNKPQLLFNKQFDLYSIDENQFNGVFEFRDYEEASENIKTIKLIDNRLENIE